MAGAVVRRGARRRSATERTTALRAPDRPEPWGRGAWVVLLVLLAVGLIGMVIGWSGISGTADLEEQTRWLGVGIGSLIVAGIGMVAWLVAGLISLAKLRRGVLRDLAVSYPDAKTQRRDETAPQQGVGTYGIATGMRRYHRADCDVLVDKDVRWLDAEALHFAGALPCGMCDPDGTSVS
jgi:hypothetical protein